MKQAGGKKRKGLGRPRGKRNASGPPVESDVITLQEVADYLLCHYTTIYRIVWRGELPAFRLGSDFRFRRSDIDKWIAEQHGPAGSGPEARKQKPAAKKPAPREGRSK
jgi:excisionase family DNA binding protein